MRSIDLHKSIPRNVLVLIPKCLSLWSVTLQILLRPLSATHSYAGSHLQTGHGNFQQTPTVLGLVHNCHSLDFFVHVGVPYLVHVRMSNNQTTSSNHPRKRLNHGKHAYLKLFRNPLCVNKQPKQKHTLN